MSEDDEEPVRQTWYGMNQPRPKLPYYLRPSKRLRSLDEFEAPEWKRRTRWAEDDKVTVKGVARETMQWLLIFAITAFVVGSAWMWFAGADGCAEVTAGFKLGWC